MSTKITPESVPPLDDTPLIQYADTPVAKWLMWFPPIGWLLHQSRWQHWASPVRNQYEAMLRERPIIPAEIWGNADQQAIAATLLTIIDDNFGWPNTRFVPWDPVAVVMWAYEDGLDDTVAINDIEKAFSVAFTDDAWRVHYNRTLFDLINSLLEHTGSAK